MKIGDRIPELQFKMYNHSEDRLKSMKFHRVLETPEMFYIKFPVFKNDSGKALLTGRIVVSTKNGEVNCYLYGQTGELYPAFFAHNHNTDNYIYKINKLYIEELKKFGIKEIENDNKHHKKRLEEG